MALRHRLAGLIWTAIVVIAVQLVPGWASAHPGHSHPPPASSSSSLPQDITDDQLQQTFSDEAAETLVLALDPPAPRASAASGGCTGGCCGTGIGCCGAVLAGSPDALPTPKRTAEVVSITFERSSGIDPEGLARPPRTLD